ncbi:hypothetical protein POM88_012203 [Heracleum sosnowskyi]|uniref:Uncharacterized protein n=1 Tax=Heracleum sosnowskyi TaxID=360622 RepID=A0AAD8IZF3_9APIA|nr:hypothetical protein POM88_012203 [Heracleum sosnowskyi]
MKFLLTLRFLCFYEVQRCFCLGTCKQPWSVKYDVYCLFSLPWLCVLISVGYFVCFDSFLSIVTVMPIRLVMVAWRSLNARYLTKCAKVLVEMCCIPFSILQRDWKIVSKKRDTAESITLSTCVVAHNNALLALLVSNNFVEIKSSVFKRFSRDNVQVMVYSGDVVGGLGGNGSNEHGNVGRITKLLSAVEEEKKEVAAKSVPEPEKTTEAASVKPPKAKECDEGEDEDGNLKGVL